MSDLDNLHPQAKRLVELTVDEFGIDTVLASPDPTIRWEPRGDGLNLVPVLEVGQAELSLGPADQLLVRYLHGGVAYLGVRARGETHWLGDVPQAPPEFN